MDLSIKICRVRWKSETTSKGSCYSAEKTSWFRRDDDRISTTAAKLLLFLPSQKRKWASKKKKRDTLSRCCGQRISSQEKLIFAFVIIFSLHMKFAASDRRNPDLRPSSPTFLPHTEWTKQQTGAWLSSKGNWPLPTTCSTEPWKMK